MNSALLGWQRLAMALSVFFTALGMVLMLAGAPFAYLADCVERKHDIETVREVQAFLDGADPGQIERDRTSSRAMRLAKRTLVTVAVVALILAALCGVIALVTLR